MTAQRCGSRDCRCSSDARWVASVGRRLIGQRKTIDDGERFCVVEMRICTLLLCTNIRLFAAVFEIAWQARLSCAYLLPILIQ